MICSIIYLLYQLILSIFVCRFWINTISYEYYDKSGNNGVQSEPIGITKFFKICTCLWTDTRNINVHVAVSDWTECNRWTWSTTDTSKYSQWAKCFGGIRPNSEMTFDHVIFSVSKMCKKIGTCHSQSNLNYSYIFIVRR